MDNGFATTQDVTSSNVNSLQAVYRQLRSSLKFIPRIKHTNMYYKTTLSWEPNEGCTNRFCWRSVIQMHLPLFHPHDLQGFECIQLHPAPAFNPTNFANTPLQMLLHLLQHSRGARY
ncbi:hypothetical protein O6H91_10G090700 [Diphasiastrum complanatum]|uniref:Uncharacterized protein n=1 Tax=Diphasiastrum complanatum TaxID=34168 RepID=A0ACC2CK64_DIPCM|nr:hypothetical protein O6H91_10G090700 [Diphasiastrum complanatum]